MTRGRLYLALSSFSIERGLRNDGSALISKITVRVFFFILDTTGCIFLIAFMERDSGLPLAKIYEHKHHELVLEFRYLIGRSVDVLSANVPTLKEGYYEEGYYDVCCLCGVTRGRL